MNIKTQGRNVTKNQQSGSGMENVTMQIPSTNVIEIINQQSRKQRNDEQSNVGGLYRGRASTVNSSNTECSQEYRNVNKWYEQLVIGCGDTR